MNARAAETCPLLLPASDMDEEPLDHPAHQHCNLPAPRTHGTTLRAERRFTTLPTRLLPAAACAIAHTTGARFPPLRGIALHFAAGYRTPRAPTFLTTDAAPLHCARGSTGIRRTPSSWTPLRRGTAWTLPTLCPPAPHYPHLPTTCPHTARDRATHSTPTGAGTCQINTPPHFPP